MNLKEKQRPFFSIVIPTYNRAEDLQLAIFCILQQTFTNFEIVVSDNCSIDNTQAVVKSFNSKKIKYFRNKKTVDMISNQKKSVEHAIGKYVFIHSDDDFLPFSDSLGKLFKHIMKYRPGYIRINYVSLSMDKKRVFHYKVNKPFKSNYYLKPHQSNTKVLSFIIDSDPYFITGIIFKNNLPKDVTMIYTDPVPWVDILFYNTREFGAYFIAEPQIVASWSRRKKAKHTEHHLFTIENGGLKSEGYFNALKNKLPLHTYYKFLRRELIIIYVGYLPVIKAKVGTKKMLEISKRVRFLDPNIVTSFVYWRNLIPAIIFPRDFLFFLKDIYLYLYTISSKTENNNIIESLRVLEEKYMLTTKTKKRLFNF